MKAKIIHTTSKQVFKATKGGAETFGTVLGAVGGAFVKVLVQESACQRGQHVMGIFGTCRHCGYRPVTHVVTRVIETPVFVAVNECNHTWAKSNSYTVCCLTCGKTLDKFSYNHQEAAWARALLNQLE